MTKKPPQYLVMAAVLLTSSSSIFIRLSIMPPLVIAFYRMAISAAFIAVPLIYRKSRLSTISRRDLLLCVLSGLALALHFATWTASLSMTSVMASTVLVTCSPIFVSIMNAAFFRKRPGKTLLLCLGTAFAGTMIITIGANGEDGLATLPGNLLALAGAVFISFYLIIGQEVRKRVSTAEYSFLAYGAAAVILLVLCITLAQPLAPYNLGQFVNIAAMAVVCSVGGHTLYNMLLKYHGAFLVSLATLCEPFFASILAAIILSEIPRIQTAFGGVLVIAGLAVYIAKNRGDQ